MVAKRAAHGCVAEAWAQEYLYDQGYKFLTRNFRTKVGEIDLIVHNWHSLVFVEVRLKTHHQFGSALETITYTKQQRITRAAEVYLQCHRLSQFQNHRFDIVSFDAQSHPSSYRIEQQYYALRWVQNAFEACT
jgi:putative endonuclease